MSTDDEIERVAQVLFEEYPHAPRPLQIISWVAAKPALKAEWRKTAALAVDAIRQLDAEEFERVANETRAETQFRMEGELDG